MRIRSIIFGFAAAALLLLLSALSVLSCQQSRPRAEDSYSISARRMLPSAGLRDSVSYLLGVNFAAFLNYGGGGTDGDDFGDIDFQRVKEGIDAFLAADYEGRYMEYVRAGFQGEDYEAFAKKFRIDPACTDSLVALYLQARMDARARDNEEKGRDFFESNSAEKDIVELSVRYPDPDDVTDTLSANIQYKITKAASGLHVAMGDSLLLSYKAYRLGQERPFDQVDSLGVSALTDSTFLRGLTGALLKMHAGEEMTVYVPSELAFGAGRTKEGRAFFSPYATLVFEVVLHELVHRNADSDTTDEEDE